MEFRKQKNTLCTIEALLCFTQKNNFYLMNKIKPLILFIIQKIFFLSKNVIFLYILKNFFTILRLKIFLKY